MPKYQRRHYVDLAQLISQLREDGGQSQLFAPDEVDRFARALAQLFTRDNPRFDRARFLFACGIAEDVEHDGLNDCDCPRCVNIRK